MTIFMPVMNIILPRALPPPRLAGLCLDPKVTAQAVTWPIEPFWRLSPSWPVALGRSRPTLGGVGVPGAGERQVLFVLAQTDTRVFPG